MGGPWWLIIVFPLYVIFVLIPKTIFKFFFPDKSEENEGEGK